MGNDGDYRKQVGIDYHPMTKYYYLVKFSGMLHRWLQRYHTRIRTLRSSLVCIIHPGWLELPLARTIFHGPKPVRVVDVLLYKCLDRRINPTNDCVRITLV